MSVALCVVVVVTNSVVATKKSLCDLTNAEQHCRALDDVQSKCFLKHYEFQFGIRTLGSTLQH